MADRPLMKAAASRPPLEQAVLQIKHRDPGAGQLIQWRSTVVRLDATVLVDEMLIGTGCST